MALFTQTLIRLQQLYCFHRFFYIMYTQDMRAIEQANGV